MLELKDDDPKAVEALLRHLYDLEYMPTSTWAEKDKMPKPIEHVEVAIVADKYGAVDLHQRALIVLARVLSDFSETNDIIELLLRSFSCPDADGRLKNITEKLCNRNFVSLFEEPRFRQLLSNEFSDFNEKILATHSLSIMQDVVLRELLEDSQGKLVFKMLSPLTKLENHALEGRAIMKCPMPACGNIRLRPLDSPDLTLECNGSADHGRWGRTLVKYSQCWVNG